MKTRVDYENLIEKHTNEFGYLNPALASLWTLELLLDIRDMIWKVEEARKK